jgi:tRNA threonylcarbamoyladenosine biosynthesis protein TsaE
MILTTYCETQTEALGEKLGALLEDGMFVALSGELGAGKTAFTRGIAGGMGITGVASPTFTIVMEHDGRHKLYHLDVYRLSGAEELYEAGYEDYLESGVIIMEWPERVEEALPAERLDVTISIAGEDERTFVFEARGARYEALLARLEA